MHDNPSEYACGVIGGYSGSQLLLLDFSRLVEIFCKFYLVHARTSRSYIHADIYGR